MVLVSATQQECFHPPSLTNSGIDTRVGATNADHPGPLHVLLFNLRGSVSRFMAMTSPLTRFLSVSEGDRVARLIIERIYTAWTGQAQTCYFERPNITSTITICKFSLLFDSKYKHSQFRSL